MDTLKYKASRTISIESILGLLNKKHQFNTPFLIQSIIITMIIIALVAYCKVRDQAHPVYESVSNIPEMPVAIVFGAGIGTAVLKDRVSAAVSLYKGGKIRKLLMTGDNGHLDYDEPEAMKALAVAAGIPSKDIVCDYAGFRTYDSLYRAKNIFDVHKAVLVTQAFHLPRAMFIARHLGLSVVGMDASLRSYGFEQYWYELREIIATETAWLDIIMQRKPKFLGKKEPLFVLHGFIRLIELANRPVGGRIFS